MFFSSMLKQKKEKQDNFFPFLYILYGTRHYILHLLIIILNANNKAIITPIYLYLLFMPVDMQQTAGFIKMFYFKLNCAMGSVLP